MLYCVVLLCLCLELVAGGMDVPSPPECGYGCPNGGQCTWNGYEYGYRCECPYGYTGQFCETEITSCYAMPCENYGTCEMTTDGGDYCKCLEGFTGQRCETVITSCSERPCENYGTCEMTMDGGDYCNCQEGFTGQRCETALLACESCSPYAECYTPPCECQCTTTGELMCFQCQGEKGGDCHMNAWNSNSTMCTAGCKVATYVTEAYSWYKRGCADMECWADCEGYEDDGMDGLECTMCCYEDFCNYDEPIQVGSGAIIGINTLTASLMCLLAAVFA